LLGGVRLCNTKILCGLKTKVVKFKCLCSPMSLESLLNFIVDLGDLNNTKKTFMLVILSMQNKFQQVLLWVHQLECFRWWLLQTQRHVGKLTTLSKAWNACFLFTQVQNIQFYWQRFNEVGLSRTTLDSTSCKLSLGQFQIGIV